MRIFLKNRVIKFLYKRFCILKVSTIIILNLIFKKNLANKFPKIYYAGAKAGDIGGPMVKIYKLNKFFPEIKWKFNLIYALSNSPNLSNWSIRIIQKNKTPLILNQNGVFYPAWYEGNWKKQNLLISKVYHSADYVFWQSDFCRKTSELFLGKRRGDGEILYNSVDTDIFLPIKKKDDKIFNFLLTGNIRNKNNYRLYSVLQAIKEISKFNKYIHFYIAGFVENLNLLHYEIENLKIKKYVTFLGIYSQNVAPLIYQKADAYITMSYQDNCPSAVIEAMSCGLPILYSSSGGVPEIVGSEAGVGLEVAQDWEQIHIPKTEQIIKGIFEVMDKKNSMSVIARERAVELFDVRNWLKRHSEIFEMKLKN